MRWSAYEHEHIERERDWYIALGIAAVCIAIVSILFSDALFALLILVAAFTIALLARIPPELVQFELSDRGIRVAGRMHRFDEITAFWVEEEHHSGRPHLLLTTKKIMHPTIIIPIEHIDPHTVRSFLKEHSHEKHMHEPVAHRILEMFGI